MKPSLAHHLLKTFTSPGDHVIDPFSGSGTIPFEAALLGCKATGLDISLLATAVTNAKVARSDPQRVSALLVRLAEWLADTPVDKRDVEEAKLINFNGKLADYFHQLTFEEILSARGFFRNHKEDSPEYYLVLACLLHVLHGNRPYALSRRSHPITPFSPTGPTTYNSVIEKVTTKVERSLAADRSDGYVGGWCYQGDILSSWPDSVQNIDAVITSPPFFDSTRFYMTNWMRYWFCGWSKSDFSEQPTRFIETLQRESLDIYDGIFRQSKERMTKGGVVVLHLGRSKKCDMAAELKKVGRKYFKVVDVFDESVAHCESHGVKDKGTVTSHTYLVLENS